MNSKEASQINPLHIEESRKRLNAPWVGHFSYVSDPAPSQKAEGLNYLKLAHSFLSQTGEQGSSRLLLKL